MFRLGAAIVLIAIIVGFAAVQFFWPRAEPGCRTLDFETIEIIGTIDSALADCVADLIGPDILVVRVSSPGGETRAGRRIGHMIGDHPRTLVVDGWCMSSCANYFVPAADRLVIEPHSLIGLHGTPDPFLLARGWEDFKNGMDRRLAAGDVTPTSHALSLAAETDRNAEGIAEEEAFAVRFGVPKGWRLYRDAGDDMLGFLRHFSGSDDHLGGNWGMLIVEPAMLHSCLPALQVERPARGRTDTLRRQIRSWVQRIAVLGASSGDLECRLSESPDADARAVSDGTGR